MVDPDKKLGRPVPAQPEPREPWSQRDARIIHGLDLLWRLIVGFIAALIGGYLLYVILKGVLDIAARGVLAPNEPPLALFGMVAMGSGLVAFACGQVLQLAWVGGDQGFDQRLWSSLTSRERGLWRLREDSSGYWTWRLFIALALGVMLYADLLLGRLFWREALAGRWLPLGSAVVCTGAMLALAFFALRGRARRPYARPGDGWVSRGKWVFDGAAASYKVALVYVAVIPFSVLVVYLDNNDAPLWAYVLLPLFLLVFAASEAWDIWHARRYGAPKLEVVRETDRPLTLACEVTLPADPKLGRYAWRARLRAFGVVGRGTRTYRPWLETITSVDMQGRTGRFRLQLEIPRTVPYALSSFELMLESGARRPKPIAFLLPPDIAFPEEYPAG